MQVKPGDIETFIPPKDKPFEIRTSYALGNRELGLLFNQRAVPGAVWKCTVDGKDDLIISNTGGQELILGHYVGIQRISFLFDYMSFPYVTLENDEGFKLYRFDNHGGDVVSAELLLELKDVRCATLYRTEYADLGSVFNQPGLLYIDTSGNVLNRSYTTNFQVVDETPMITGLLPTDEIRIVGMTTQGRLQIEVSKLK